MRPAAQLLREDAFQTRHAQHAHLLRILLAKQSHRARLHRFFQREFVRLHTLVTQNVIINETLNLRDLIARERLEVREVETQIVGRDDRPRLLHMRPQHLAQSRVHQVRRRMIPPRRIPLLHIHPRRDHLANFQTPLFDFDLMNDQPLRRRISINDFRTHVLAHEHAHIPHLPAALRVKRRVIQDDFSLVALAQRFNFIVAFHQSDNF